MERLPTPIFWPGEFHESDKTEQLSLYSTGIFSGCFWNIQIVYIIIHFVGHFGNLYFQLFNNIHQPLGRLYISASSRDRMMSKKKKFSCSHAVYSREWETNNKYMMTQINVY